jgi:putative (di)nucleoside polyphosphate hydrolase
VVSAGAVGSGPIGTATIDPMPSAHFRAGVVIVVVNDRGEVLAFERNDVRGQWQLPQGGIDVGERPVQAAWRELAEETGLGPDDVELVGEHPDWTVYEWPDHLRERGRRLGQAHRWFTFRPRDPDVEPSPDGSEFVDWRWADRTWLIDQVVEFRRAGYRRVLLG